MGVTSGPRYNFHSQLPREQPRKEFWDPVATLDIINPDRGCLTCVGYAPSRGRRCRNPINMGNRSSAFHLLGELSYIDVSTTNIDAKLRQLARLTLCLRYHQDQEHEMVRQWNRKIESLRTTSRTPADSDPIWERLQKGYEKVKEKKTPGNENESIDEVFARLLDWLKQEQEARRRDEETRKSREQEQQRQQQEREKKERQKREQEQTQRKRQEEEERKKREEEERERKRREETERRKEAEEAKAREAREREERNERVRQRAEQIRKERERKAKEQAAKAREEWDKAWLEYVLRWDELKSTSLPLSRFSCFHVAD